MDVRQSHQTGSSKKLKILCLHGYRQNELVFREKTGSMRGNFRKSVDFVFLNAPHKLNIEETSDDGSNVTENALGWWFSSSEHGCGSSNDDDIGFKQSVQYLLEAIRNEGNIDGLLGFSQGAAMIHILNEMRERNEIEFDIKFTILISAFVSKLANFQRFLPTSTDRQQLVIPSLHIYGDTDQIINSSMSQQVSERYSRPIVIVHPGGHFVPSLKKYKADVDVFLDQFRV